MTTPESSSTRERRSSRRSNTTGSFAQTTTSETALTEATRRRSSATTKLSTLESKLSRVGSAYRKAQKTKDQKAEQEAKTLLLGLDEYSKRFAIEHSIAGLGQKQLEAYGAYHSGDYRIIACTGVNRSGKTHGGGTAYCEYLRDEAPVRSQHICVTTDQRLSRKNQQRFIWDHIPHDMFDVEWSGPKNGFGSINPVVILDKRNDANPEGRNVEVHFMAESEFENNANAFEGLTVETAWIDEAISHELFSAVSMRCGLAEDGRLLITSIPKADWFYEIIYHAKKEDRVWFKLFEPFDNPTMTEEKWANICKNVPPHERDVRLKGVPAMAGSLVFTEFDRTHHVIPRSEVPEDVVWYAGHDVGADHPTAVVICAVDKQNRLYVVDEYIARNTTIEQDVEALKEILGNRVLQEPAYLDPSAFSVTKANQVSVAYQYINAGWNVAMPLRTSDYGERGMVFQMKEMFQHDEIYVCENCQETIRELSIWKYRRDQRNKPVTAGSPFEDQNNDAIDALRYLISMNPTYTRGKVTVVDDSDPVFARGD